MPSTTYPRKVTIGPFCRTARIFPSGRLIRVGNDCRDRHCGSDREGYGHGKENLFHNSHLLICGFSEEKCGDSSSAPIQLAQMTRWLSKSFFIMVTCRNAR